MSASFSFDKTITAQHESDMRSIAAPLQNHLQINYFSYLKIYNDQSHIVVSTGNDWLRCIYDNFIQYGIYQKSPTAFTDGYHLWSQLEDQRVISVMRDDFHVDHGITLVKKHEQFCEFYAFGTHLENHGMTNWYLNNLDLLKAYTCDFKEKSKALLQHVEGDRFIFPKRMFVEPDGILHSPNHVNEFNARTSFLKEICMGEPNLTQREHDLTPLLIRGHTAKEIARLLGLSFRTVEEYISSLKNKLEVRNKAELVAKLCKAFGNSV